MTNANTPAGPLDQAAITAALRAAGMIEERPPSDFHRIKVNGPAFLADDQLIGVTNIATNEPAFVAQIVDVPIEMQALYFESDLAQFVDRPEIDGKMCKSHYDIPEQAREHAFDGTSCRTCPVNPFVKREDLPTEARGKKCMWRGDIQLRLLDPIDDEPGWRFRSPTIYTLSLSFTGMVEFKGLSRTPEKGHVSDINFMQKLARLGASMQPDNPTAGLMHGLTQLRLGGVVAEVRSLAASSADGARNYEVTSFNPIKILDMANAIPALESTEPDITDAPAATKAAKPSTELDDAVPF